MDFSLNNISKIEMPNGDLVRSVEILPDGKMVGFRVVSGGVKIVLFKDYITDVVDIQIFTREGKEILNQFQTARLFLIRFRQNYTTIVKQSIKHTNTQQNKSNHKRQQLSIGSTLANHGLKAV